MENKAALHLYRAAEHDWRAWQQCPMRADLQRKIKSLEEHIHGHVGRTVDDDAECATHMVFADVQDRAAEHRIQHGRHGDQEMIGELQQGEIIGRCSGRKIAVFHVWRGGRREV